MPGGDKGIRTLDPLLAGQVLSQLSYTPVSAGLPALRFRVVGSSGIEPPTSRLSGARSNRLSYEPVSFRISAPAPETLKTEQQFEPRPLLVVILLFSLSVATRASAPLAFSP